MRRDRLFIAILICSASCVAAQSASQDAREPKPPEASEKALPTGTVTGRVFLDDTKSPARKAAVYLEPVESLRAQAEPDRRKTGLVSARVDAQSDGSYTFTHVSSGSYYVVATSPGYISPAVALSLARTLSAGGLSGLLDPQEMEAKEKILQSLPRVDVQLNQAASADVVLERGGAISGNITYDDGVPAAGLRVQVLTRVVRDGKPTWDPLTLGFGHLSDLNLTTDDRGNFRISGLPAGKYAIDVSLEFMNDKAYFDSTGGSSGASDGPSRLEIYSGNTPRVKDAAGFTLQTREERTGEDIVIPITKVHRIKGHIVSGSDGHVVNSGGVGLINPDDHSPAGFANLSEDESSFTLNFILEGDYILSCSGSADVDYLPIPRQEGIIGPPQFNTRVLHQYGTTAIFLHVDRDMDGVTLAVPEPTAKEAQMYKDAMQQQENQQNQNAAQQ